MIENGVPGSTSQHVLTAINMREDACKLSTAVIPLEEEYILPLEHIFIAVRAVGGESYLGNIQHSAALSTISAATLASTAHVFGYLKPGESTDFIWYATIDPTLGNVYQGSSLSISLQLQMRCDDPDAILPKASPAPTPTHVPTPVASDTLPSTPDTSTEQSTSAQNAINPSSSQVLGLSTHSSDCPLSPALTLAVKRPTLAAAQVLWSGSLTEVTVAYQDLQSGNIYRHRAVSRSPYTLVLSPKLTEYAFWLEEATVCGDQVASDRVILGTGTSMQDSAIAHSKETSSSAATSSSAVLGAQSDPSPSTLDVQNSSTSSGAMILPQQTESLSSILEQMKQIIGLYEGVGIALLLTCLFFVILRGQKRKKQPS
jgi:hypothetical protein